MSVRTRLAVFLALTFAISFAVQVRVYRLGGPIDSHLPEVFALMWTPGLVSIACRLGFREGFADVSFRIGRAPGARPWLVAWLFPLGVGAIAYSTAWLTGLAAFEAPAPGALGKMLGLEGAPGAQRFLVTLGLALFVGTPAGALTALGEEIGWRGYLVTRLIEAKIPRPLLVSGLIWGLWHVPLILTGQYAAGPWPALSAALFLVGITAGGYLAAYVRLESGSMWAATLFHASWNSLIQGPFDRFTRGGGAATTQSIWIGESGILVVLVSAALALVVLRRGVRMRLSPSAPPVPVAAP